MSEELTMKKYHFIITPTGERKLVFSPDVTYIDGEDAECLYNQIMNGEPSTETDEQAMKKIAEEDARLRTRSYFVSTAGDVSAAMIRRYVETQKTRGV